MRRRSVGRRSNNENEWVLMYHFNPIIIWQLYIVCVRPAGNVYIYKPQPIIIAPKWDPYIKQTHRLLTGPSDQMQPLPIHLADTLELNMCIVLGWWSALDRPEGVNNVIRGFWSTLRARARAQTERSASKWKTQTKLSFHKLKVSTLVGLIEATQFVCGLRRSRTQSDANLWFSISHCISAINTENAQNRKRMHCL